MDWKCEARRPMVAARRGGLCAQELTTTGEGARRVSPAPPTSKPQCNAIHCSPACRSSDQSLRLKRPARRRHSCELCCSNRRSVCPLGTHTQTLMLVLLSLLCSRRRAPVSACPALSVLAPAFLLSLLPDAPLFSTRATRRLPLHFPDARSVQSNAKYISGADSSMRMQHKCGRFVVSCVG